MERNISVRLFLNYVTLHLVNPNVFSCNRFYTVRMYLIKWHYQVYPAITELDLLLTSDFFIELYLYSSKSTTVASKFLRTALDSFYQCYKELSSVVQLWPTCTQPVQNVVSVLLIAVAPSVVFCFIVQCVVQRTAYRLF